jgi:regulator of RNase E activity RraA
MPADGISEHPGELNFAIAIDGTVIGPDDLMIGDDDGLRCITRPEAETSDQPFKTENGAGERRMATDQIRHRRPVLGRCRDCPSWLPLH